MANQTEQIDHLFEEMAILKQTIKDREVTIKELQTRLDQLDKKIQDHILSTGAY